jgi:hypothetical protein
MSSIPQKMGERLERTLSAVASDGAVHTIQVFRENLIVKTQDGQVMPVSNGNLVFRLLDGTKLHSMHDGTYRTDDSSLTLTPVP